MIATTTQPISRTGVSIHPTAPIFSTILPSRRLNPKSLPRALSQPELCPQLRAWLPFRVWGHPRKGKGRRAKASRSAPLCFVAGSASARPRTRRRQAHQRDQRGSRRSQHESAARLGGVALPGSPPDFFFIDAAATEKWGKVVKLSGAKPE